MLLAECYVPAVILAVLLAAPAAQCINVETKLDFLGEKQDKPNVVEKVLVFEKKQGDETKLVCGPGGCNATGPKIEGSDTIATDVVIEVKTNVKPAENSKNKTDEEAVPDVPIVLGLGGVDNTINPEENAINPHPYYPRGLGYPDVRNGNGFVPSHGIPHVNVAITPPRPLLVSDTRYDYVPSDRYLPPKRNPPRRYGVVFEPLGPNRQSPNNWKSPSTWNGGRNGFNYQRPYYNPTTQYPWTQCTCLNQNPAWHPTTHNSLASNPGRNINDKLAPLH